MDLTDAPLFTDTAPGPDDGAALWLVTSDKVRIRVASWARDADKGTVLMPGGRFGPAFVVLDNFYVIKTYNNADLYALIVGHIADRFSNDRPYQGKWSAKGLRRDVVTDMQKRLEKRGLDVGGSDGLIGFRTRIAVGQYQKDNGMTPTCWPNAKLLAHIKRTTPLQ